MTPRKKKPPAVLITNPNAGRLPVHVRREVVDALRDRFNLEAFSTTAPNTGTGFAAEAAEEGAELVIAFGGDGHVNEVANGVAGTGTALGIIPGGTMNVFSRALGVPQDPFEAIAQLASSNHTRRVPLGRMNERYFTFSAGCGFDAEAAERVEAYLSSKRLFGEVFFYWSAFRVLAGTYRHRAPSMKLRGDFGETEVAMAIACNAGPYAYFAGRAVNIAPDVNLDGGIDVFALRSMKIEALPFYVWRVAISGNLVHHPDVVYHS
ncbi:MAG: diacylglycerol/lipid kinase family protein, partial [Actinomycetota bacterium]